MFASFDNSIELMKASWEVVKKDKEILTFPALAGTVLILMFILFPLGIFFSGFFNIYVLVIGVAVIYFMSYYIITWCNVAIVGCATIRLKGGDPTVSDGVRIANENLGSIAKWALLSAGVGLLMAALRSRRGGGRVAAAILGTAWNVLTFFIIPVLIYEKQGIFKSLRRSGNLFISTWAETLIGNFGFSIIIGLLALLGFVPFIIGFLTFDLYILLACLVLSCIYWGILGVVSGAMTMVFRAALYQYATSGKLPGGYAPFTAFIPPPLSAYNPQYPYPQYPYQPYQYQPPPQPYMPPPQAPAPQSEKKKKTSAPAKKPAQAVVGMDNRPGLGIATPRCKNCGAPVSEDSIACEKCGEGV